MCNCDVHPGPSCEVRANRKGGFQPHTSESLITRRGSCKRELRSHSPKLARLPATALLSLDPCDSHAESFLLFAFLSCFPYSWRVPSTDKLST